ncbi:MAG TPA: riboflavin synthase [Clostridiales bacterium]|nr:riboflavin synthase [Clostridiales bacterium]
MFTGLVEEIGKVQSVVKGGKSAQITIEAQKVLSDVQIGDSICTNGVCLTVTGYTANTFTVDVMPETMRRSNLKDLKPGSPVNLERALRVGDRLGGHWVTGHIDGTGIIQSITPEDNAIWIRICASKDILKYIVQKGSIAVDGISLTVAGVDGQGFQVSIIPHTKEATTLSAKNPGDEVNLECDLIGKYVEKLMKFQESPDPQRSLDLDFLRKYGFA